MYILTIRTDKPEAEIGLYDDTSQKVYDTWPAHRELAETIHRHIADLLESQEITLASLGGIVMYQGPGSFTGLRIGISVGNAFASGLSIPIVGSTETNWIEQGLARLVTGENDQIVVPAYGAEPHITAPRK